MNSFCRRGASVCFVNCLRESGPLFLIYLGCGELLWTRITIHSNCPRFVAYVALDPFSRQQEQLQLTPTLPSSIVHWILLLILWKAGRHRWLSSRAHSLKPSGGYSTISNEFSSFEACKCQLGLEGKTEGLCFVDPHDHSSNLDRNKFGCGKL